MSRIVSELLYQIKADATQFTKTVKDSSKQFEDLGKSLTKTGKALTLGLTVPLTAAGAGLVKLAIESGKAADKILDLEQITGLSTDTLQEFKNVAVVAGVDFEGLVGTLTRFQGRLQSIDQEGSESAEAVARLGVSVRDTNGNIRAADDLFPEFLGALNQIENITERNSLAQKIFGRSLQDLGPVLSLTADQIKNAREEASKLGLVQSKDALIAANNFRIQVDQLKASIQGQALALGTDLIPLVEKLVPVVKQAADAVIGVVRGFIDLPPALQKGAIGLAVFAAGIGPVLTATGTLITNIPKITAAVQALTGPKALAAFAAGGPIVIGIAAAAAALLAVGVSIANNRREQESLNRALQGQATLTDTIAQLEKTRTDLAAARKRAESASGAGGGAGAVAAIINLESQEKRLQGVISAQQQLRAEEERLAAQRAEQEAIQQRSIALAEQKKAIEESLAFAENERIQARIKAEQDFIKTLNNIDGLITANVFNEKRGLQEKITLREREIQRIEAAAIAGEISAQEARNQIASQQSAIDRYYARLLELEEKHQEQVEESSEEVIDSVSDELDARRDYYRNIGRLQRESDKISEENNKKELERIKAEKIAKIQQAQEYFGVAKGIINSLADIANSNLEKELAAIDTALNAELEANGLAKKSKIETLEEQLAKALEDKDTEKAAEIQKQIDETKITDKYEKEKAILKAQAARKTAILNKSIALFEIGLNTAKAITEAGINVVLAIAMGVLGAAQAAAVLATPIPEIPSFAQGVSGFMVPPGFPNDSFPILVQSGERVTVETPQQQASGSGGNTIFQLGTIIADPAGLRELDRLLRKYGTVENMRRG
jgi:hypothetical protein